MEHAGLPQLLRRCTRLEHELENERTAHRALLSQAQAAACMWGELSPGAAVRARCDAKPL